MMRRRGFSNIKAQVTIFIIIAILVIAGVVIYFVVRNPYSVDLPKEMQPVYDYYLNCLSSEIEESAGVMGSQAGYLELPEFESGSQYMPFSSQLDFMGSSVPYWYYISGNGIIKEQIPTKANMENQLEDYLESASLDCDFSAFEDQGFDIGLSDENGVKVSVDIKDNKIDADLNVPLVIYFGDESAVVSKHKVSVNSKLGDFYNTAKKIYASEKKNLFLERYSVDVLRLYAPVDGVELSCAPKTWIKQQVKQDLKNGLEANVQAIKIKGNYYEISKKENKYFIQDIGDDLKPSESVNMIYSPTWPTKIEVYPDENTMIANPIGMQSGMGILGFCYVPYHFVYDIAYPVLIQVSDSSSGEIFQFPVGIVIDKNLPRNGMAGEALPEAESELCKSAIQKVDVYTYDVELNPIEADIDFECLGERCNIGKTEKGSENDAVLSGMFPQCVNGYITAKADGYVKSRYLVSTNKEDVANIIMDKLYELDVDVKLDGKETSDSAIISFSSKDYMETISWPSQSKIQLSEGQYNVSVYLYSNSKITIPAVNQQQCTEVAKPGLLGMLGQTEEKCFDINLPSQELSNIVSGGGMGEDYLINSDLERGKLTISVESVPTPTKLEDLQDSYNLLKVKPVYLEFE